MKYHQALMSDKGSYTEETDTLALFDFDGTITKGDTFIKFIKFCRGSFRFYFGMWLLSPILTLYFLKIIPNYKTKRIVFSYFFKNWNYGKFKLAGEEFCKTKLPSMLRQSALEKIRSHQKKQHRLILVTASIKEWVEPWCMDMGIEIISTQAEVQDHKLTGNFATANCYGPEKVNRIKKVLNPEDFGTIYAYGDSRGDKEMLAMSQKPYYQHFEE